MSLEQAINDHAAAIRELASAILNMSGANGAPAVAVKTEVKATQSKEELIKQAIAGGEAKLAAKKKAEAEAKAAKEAEAEADKAAEEDLAGSGEPVTELDYAKDVEEKFKAFLKAKGREAGLALLGKYKAKSGSQVAQADLAAFLADIEAA